MAANNHTATHLIHYVPRKVLDHMSNRKVHCNTRPVKVDFSHFSKLTREELFAVESIANRFVRDNFTKEVTKNITLKEALSMGAIALFGENTVIRLEWSVSRFS